MTEIGEFETRVDVISNPEFYRSSPAKPRPGSDEYYLGENSTRAEPILSHLPDIKAALSTRGHNTQEITTFEELLPILCEIPNKPTAVIEIDPSTKGQLIYDKDTGIIVALREAPATYERAPYIYTAFAVDNDESAKRYMAKRSGGNRIH